MNLPTKYSRKSLSAAAVAAVVAVLSSHSSAASPDPLTLSDLRCEYAADPLGLDAPQPRFSWIPHGKQRGQSQSACQILVAASREKLGENVGDKWDSGRVAGDRSVNVHYRGKPLSSGETCFWKVRVWDGAGQASGYSRPASFEMGLLEQSDWKGKWIGAGSNKRLEFVSGRHGKAVRLDGKKQTIRISHAPQLKSKQQLTICSWIRPAACSDAWQEIYRKDDGAARHLLAIGKDKGVYGLWFGLGVGGRYVERGAPIDASKLCDKRWHFVAASFDGKTMTFLLDGRRIASVPVQGKLDASWANPAYIGSLNGKSEFFGGDIDDVRLYGRALTLQQLDAAAKDSAAAREHLLAHWKLDDDLCDCVSKQDGVAVNAVRSEAATLVRKQFVLDKPIKRARAYVSGLGWYELHINGRKAGDRVLDPAATDYEKRILYATYDVTDMLKPGANAVGAMLGNGWYCEPGIFRYGDSTRFLAQINIEYADGGAVSLSSDGTWKTADGPILYNSIYGGEIYDARLEKAGWSKADYDDSAWQPAAIKEHPGGRLESQTLPAIKVNQTPKAVKLTNPRPNVYVYDMGQLFGGWVRLRAKGPAGTKITIKYSARLFKDSGLIDKRRHIKGNETDVYIMKGDPNGEVYEPRFTYHPVNYVQIEGYPGVPSLEDLHGRVVHSSIDMSGDFECSNAMLNQIHLNALWTFTNQMYGVPLDCLHREHWGWLDPGTDASTAFTRKHMPSFWTKWLRDVKCTQDARGVVSYVAPAYSPRMNPDLAWTGNYPILVWYTYRYFDDRGILEEHYPALTKLFDYFTTMAENHIISKGNYGDHMEPGDAPGQEVFISTKSPPPLIWTCYYYHNARILASMADVLGKQDDARRYAGLAEAIKAAFNAKWLDSQSGQYAGGTQTSNLLPLSLGIVPEDVREKVAANVVCDIMETRKGHLHTGNSGTTALVESLVKLGHGDVLFQVATVPTYPGWGYMVAQGATTIWEAWGRVDDGWIMHNSGAESMYMWGTIERFFYNDILGIQGPEYYGTNDFGPGFCSFSIKPHVLGDLTHAKGSVKTVRGMVCVSWKRTGGSLLLDVSIPANSRARVGVPKIGLKNAALSESGKTIWKDGKSMENSEGVSGGSEDDDHVSFDVGSGEYHFVLTDRKNE